MTMRPRSAAVLSGVVLAATFAASAPANADVVTVDDPTSDVWEAQYDAATDTTTYVEAGSVANLDVQSLRVRHLANRIVLKATYAELNKKDVVLGASGTLRFNAGPEVGFSLDTYSKWSGESVLFKT